MNLTRRRLIASTPAMTAAAALPLAARAEGAQTLKFVLIGDWGRDGRDNQTDVANQMATTAAALDSKFVVSVGDNFYENGVTGLDDPYWQNSFERIYTAPSLQTPWRVILGNHDYRGNVQAQIDYSAQSPRWRLPARYYQVTETLPDGGSADFFYVDTSPFMSYYVGTTTDISGQDTNAQLAWLDQALGSSKAEWKIVIGHHPIYTALTGKDHDQPDLIARLDPVIRAHGVKIYINGHDHTLQSVEVGGVTYVTNGAGSETYEPGTPGRDGFCSGAHGFMTCALSSAKLDFALVDMAGTTLYSQSVTPT